MTPYTSQRLALRGLEHRVLTWGRRDAPMLFLLHGWMDVGASFQFLVDALRGTWHVVAPDLRGFGQSAWQPQGYWFADYIADLEALLDHFAPGQAVNLVGHSLGGNIAMHYAGVRPQRVARLVSLDGFGIPAEDPGAAPGKYAKWLDALRDPPSFRPYADLDAVAARLRKNNPRLPADKAAFLAARVGGRCCRTAVRDCAPTRATSCRFRPCIGWRKCMPSGARSPRRRCGSRPSSRPSPRGWASIRKARGLPRRSRASAAGLRTSATLVS